MGLDMYLRAERYVSDSAMFDADDPENFDCLLQMFFTPELVEAARKVQFSSARVQFTVAYWRKANQIHSWFVRECQDGRDECQLAYVSREQLRTLREICLRVLVSRDDELADELLAPQGGYFFGGVEYDEWYWDRLKDTVVQLDRVLALPPTWTFYYQSSW